MAHQYSPTFERLSRAVTRHSALVLLVWIAIGGALSIAVPPLEKVTRDHAVSPMPVDSPAMATMQEMGKKFGQEGFDNSAIVVMSSPDGFDTSAQVHYRATVDRLRADTTSVRFVQDLMGNPLTRANPAVRDQALSKDGRAWLMLIGLQGSLGSPDSVIALQRVRSTVLQSFDGSNVTAKVTGPTATFGDLLDQSLKDLPIVGAIIGVMITCILLVVYRSAFTAALPLVVMGISVFVVRGLIAAIGNAGLLPLSATSTSLMTAILAGACVNYTVFLISRYHERVRDGEPPIEALANASGSISKVTLAAAATVLVANLAQLTASLQVLAIAGPAIAIAIAVAFLANVTLAQAVIALASKRGWGLPGKDRTRNYWRRTGVFVVRRPVLTFTAGVLVLVILISFTGLVRFGYDDRAALSALHTESGEGYEILDKHFAADTVIPQFVMVTAKKDLRTPQGLADLDQMAQRMSQLPGVSKVIGITRPDGNKLTQATLAWQIGLIGKQIDRAQDQLSKDLQPQIDRMVEIADITSAIMKEFSDADLRQIQRTIPQILSMATRISARLDEYRPVIGDMNDAMALIDQLNNMGVSVDRTLDAMRAGLDLVTPVSHELDSSPVCSASPQCDRLRQQLSSLTSLDRDGVIDNIERLGNILRKISAEQSAKKTIDELSQTIGAIQPYLDELPKLQAKYNRVSGAVQKLQQSGLTPDVMRKLGERTHELACQMQDTMGAMTQAAAFLQTVGVDAANPSASGFYLPTPILASPDFKTAAARFITPDGTTALYLIQSTNNPYSAQAMDLVKTLKTVGNEARPNTELAGAEIGIGGFPALNADLQEMVAQDFREIIVVTLVVITLIMCLLLRAVVAPLYLIATVVLTYLAALGAGVLLFQVILGQPIYWAVPTTTFVMIVAVGADYNMLFISRLREESQEFMRLGTIRTVTHTGSVITAAGAIFAASMFGMMTSSIQSIVQLGFIIGFGLLLDTFLVRTLVVPSIATMLGKKSWWPAKT